MLLSSLFALAVLSSSTAAGAPRGSFDSVVPRLPDGYGPGRVSIRVHTVPIPESVSPALVGDLFGRTGLPITEMQGVRIELLLPDEVEFASMQARVVDGLVLEPQRRSFLGRVGGVVVSLLRFLLVGRLISSADDLSLPGAAWAAALGAPDPDEELVRLSTSETLTIERGAGGFSDHGGVVVYRTVLALSPWTELVDLQLRCRDRTNGQTVEFLIPSLSLRGDGVPPQEGSGSWQWALASGR